MTQATLDEFEKLLEESFSNSHSVADIVEGTVIRKEQDGYLVSVRGAKTEAFLSNKEISSAEEETPLEKQQEEQEESENANTEGYMVKFRTTDPISSLTLKIKKILGE